MAAPRCQIFPVVHSAPFQGVEDGTPFPEDERVLSLCLRDQEDYRIFRTFFFFLIPGFAFGSGYAAAVTACHSGSFL